MSDERCEYCDAGSRPYQTGPEGRWAHEGGVLCQLQKPAEVGTRSYVVLCDAIEQIVAQGLCAYTTELGSHRDVYMMKYAADPNFRAQVRSVTANIMHALDLYEGFSRG